MTIAKRLMQGVGGVDKLYVDDVFSAYTYDGNGSTQTINNGIDLAGKGGMVWGKNRTTAYSHEVFDSAMNGVLYTNAAVAKNGYGIGDITEFTSTGYTLGYNSHLQNYVGPNVSWTFRNADKFFKVATLTKSAGSNATLDLSSLGIVGMVKVKRTDAAGSWYVWHRSLPAGQLLIGETTAAAATLGHITVSGTTLTLVNGVIADGTYHIEAYAHDPSAEGIIQCGSFTTDASGNATVNLGWEPQYLTLKPASAEQGWWVVNSACGFFASPSTTSNYFSANTANAEAAWGGVMAPTATGFITTGLSASATVIYLAIRRPNKPPTLGTQVYNAIARTGTGAAATVTGVGFAPDLAIVNSKLIVSSWGATFSDRLRGAKALLRSTGTVAERLDILDEVTKFNMDGVSVGASVGGISNYSTYAYINHFFKRAPGVLSQICYDGTGANKTEAHDLSVLPELWLFKGRSGSTQWVWGSSLLAATEKVVMPSPAGKVTDATAWNSTYPTASAISLGTASAINTNAATYTGFLWASLAGVSKVFKETKTAGADKSVNCGFTTGARFVLLFRVDAAGSVYVWDVVRGIVSGNDPYLVLDTTAAEVTDTDWIDPLASGFTIVDGGLPNGDYLGVAYS